MTFDMGHESPTTEDGAYQVLTSYAWPGNVREMKNVIQRLLLMGESVITADVVSEYLTLAPINPPPDGPHTIAFGSADELLPLREMERLFRLRYFQFVRSHSASDAEAAKKLGLAPPNYHRMSKDLGLKD
jgi:DNA-binding NtrC family response regulator